MKPELLVLLLPLGLGAGKLLLMAGEAEKRSRKLGLWATASGVGAFIPALLGPVFKDQDNGSALASCGFITILLAVIASVLAVGSLGLRRRDHGYTGAYPVAALLCGVANLFCGAGALVVGYRLIVPPPTVASNATTWRSEKYGFEVTIPSEEWKLQSSPNVLAEFRYPRFRISAMIAEGPPGRTQANYEEALAYGKMVRDDTPTTGTDERSGQNPHGHPYWMYMGEAKSKNRPYFFGVSVTRVRETPVLLMFEGQYQRQTEEGRAEETRLIRAQADTFLSSVK